jgi:hypothetical protein
MDHTILVTFSQVCLDTQAVTGKAIVRHTLSIPIQVIDTVGLPFDLCQGRRRPARDRDRSNGPAVRGASIATKGKCCALRFEGGGGLKD